jgi:excisionase family DNA binding protein
MYLSAVEARARLGVSRETFRKLVKSGDLKASKLGPFRNSPYRVKETDLEAYMDRQAARVAS